LVNYIDTTNELNKENVYKTLYPQIISEKKEKIMYPKMIDAYYSLEDGSHLTIDETATLETIEPNSIGVYYIYGWTVVKQISGLYWVTSLERVLIPDHGYNSEVSVRYEFGDTPVHQGSRIIGYSGPVTWTELGFNNYVAH
jgi:hypothetical protein